MKPVLILDCETTGLDPAKDFVIEVGAILWSVEHRTSIAMYSSLLDSTHANAAEAVNGIPAAILPSAPRPDDVWAEVRALASEADAFLAHNADFDRSFCLPHMPNQRAKPWICTCTDIEWPGARRAASTDPHRERPGQSLAALALAHGLGLSHAHRALTDCMTIARLLERCAELGHDIEAMLARGMRPKASFAVADTTYDPKRNELAKQNGFRWDPDRKLWWRRMPIEDAGALPFKVRRLEEPAAKEARDAIR